MTRERAELCEGLFGKVRRCRNFNEHNTIKIVVTDAMTRVDDNETGTVINVVEQESSFSEFDNAQKQVDKIVTQDQKQVERIVTHGQEQVEKVVTHAHRVGGVLWRHQSHVAKRRSHMRRSHMAKQFHPVHTRHAH